jgi:hypothetical protein
MIKFERGRNTKEILDVGLAQKIPEWMAIDPFGDGYDPQKYMDVWIWALKSSNYDVVFRYIVDRNNEKWFSEVIDVSEYGNELLWESVAHNNIEAVKALLAVPNLFPEEAMSREFGTTLIKEINPATGSPYRTAFFGNIIELARTRGFSDLIDPLLEYYHEEYNRFRKG